MCIIPVLINPSNGATPELPAYETLPRVVSHAMEVLEPLETRLTREELCRFVISIFSIATSLILEYKPHCFVHFATTTYDTPHAFSIYRGDHFNLLLIHFNKMRDQKKENIDGLCHSLAIDLLSGDAYSWITPSAETPEAQSKLSLLKLYSKEFPKINRLYMPQITGKKRKKPALLIKL